MIRSANRSRLLELRTDLAAADLGRTVLEQKRELLLQELRASVEACARARAEAARALSTARAAMAEARAAMGTFAVEAALLAQPEGVTVQRSVGSVVGVPVPSLSYRAEPFRPRYGPLGTAAELDAAGMAWQAALSRLVAYADAELRRRALRRGLARTARRLGAVETIVLPRLRAELREVASALDEEERDEALRRRCWLERRARVSP